MNVCVIKSIEVKEKWVIPGEINMKNGQPLQISPIIDTLLEVLGYHPSTNICGWYCTASEIWAVKVTTFGGFLTYLAPFNGQFLE